MNAAKSLDLMRAVSEDEARQHDKNIEIYGYTRVEGLMKPETRRRLLELTQTHFEKTEKIAYAGRPDRDYGDRMVYNLQNKDKLYLDLLEDPFLQRLVKPRLNDPYYRFLPPDVPNYILSYYNARTGGTKLDLHIDSYLPAAGPYLWAMQIAFLLEDHRLDNGCTQVVPGSHQSGRFTDREFAGLKPMLADAGDVVLWDSRLWHGTAENTSGKSRWTLIATLTQWWVKQSMDMPRSLPQAIYETLSPSQKALLGYCSIPPRDEKERINTKTGYEALKPRVEDYFS